jgi:hypothetical protein
MPFSHKFEASADDIKLVQAFKGRRMLGGLPTPEFLDKKGYLEWLKHGRPISGGALLPDWLKYDAAKTQLVSSYAPRNEDVGLYTIRAYGQGEMILEEIRLNVGNQNERAKNSRRGNDQHTVPLLEMNSL